MALERERISADDFVRFLDRPENRERRFELVRGVVHEMSPSGHRAAVIAARFVYYLSAHVLPRNLGHVTGADGGYRLSAEDLYAPDASFIASARLPELGAGYVMLPPDLAVEVVSSNDSGAVVHRKTMRYLTLGTRLIWVAYTNERLIHVYRASEDGVFVRELAAGDVLDGEDVLPGFTLPVADVLPD